MSRMHSQGIIRVCSNNSKHTVLWENNLLSDVATAESRSSKRLKSCYVIRKCYIFHAVKFPMLTCTTGNGVSGFRPVVHRLGLGFSAPVLLGISGYLLLIGPTIDRRPVLLAGLCCLFKADVHISMASGAWHTAILQWNNRGSP